MLIVKSAFVQATMLIRLAQSALETLMLQVSYSFFNQLGPSMYRETMQCVEQN